MEVEVLKNSCKMFHLEWRSHREARDRIFDDGALSQNCVTQPLNCVDTMASRIFGSIGLKAHVLRKSCSKEFSTSLKWNKISAIKRWSALVRNVEIEGYLFHYYQPTLSYHAFKGYLRGTQRCMNKPCYWWVSWSPYSHIYMQNWIRW